MIKNGTEGTRVSVRYLKIQFTPIYLLTTLTALEILGLSSTHYTPSSTRDTQLH